MANAAYNGVMSWFTDKSPVAPPSVDDLLAVKKQFEKANDDHLRRLALITVGTPVILDKDQREDVVFKVNQRTWDALQDLKASGR